MFCQRDKKVIKDENGAASPINLFPPSSCPRQVERRSGFPNSDDSSPQRRSTNELRRSLSVTSVRSKEYTGNAPRKLHKTPATKSVQVLPNKASSSQQETVQTILDKAKTLRRREECIVAKVETDVNELRKHLQQFKRSEGSCNRTVIAPLWSCNYNHGHSSPESAIPVLKILNSEKYSKQAAEEGIKLENPSTPDVASAHLQSQEDTGFQKWLVDIRNEMNTPEVPVRDANLTKLPSGSATPMKEHHLGYQEPLRLKQEGTLDGEVLVIQQETKVNFLRTQLVKEKNLSSTLKQKVLTQTEQIELLQTRIDSLNHDAKSIMVKCEDLEKTNTSLKEDGRTLRDLLQVRETAAKNQQYESDVENNRKIDTLKAMLKEEKNRHDQSKTYERLLEADLKAKEQDLDAHSNKISEALNKVRELTQEKEEMILEIEAVHAREKQLSEKLMVTENLVKENNSAGWKEKFEELQKRVQPFKEMLQVIAHERGILLEENEEIFTKLSSANLKVADFMGHQNPKQKIKYLVKLQEQLSEVQKENAQLRQLLTKKSGQERDSNTPAKQKFQTPKSSNR